MDGCRREETYRDIKDLRFDLGMKWTSVKRTDRLLKTNTSKKRTMSLFRQGLRWYELMPNMPDERLQILMDSFDQVLREHELFQGILGVV